MNQLNPVNISKTFIVAAGWLLWFGFFSVACSSDDDHQAATLESPDAAERAEETGGAALRYEVFTEGVKARLDRNKQLIDQFKVNDVSGRSLEQRTSLERKVRSIEEEMESLRSEVNNYEPNSEREDWDSFAESVESRADKIEEDLNELFAEGDVIERNL